MDIEKELAKMGPLEEPSPSGFGFGRAPVSPQSTGPMPLEMPLTPEALKSPAMSMMEQGNKASSIGRSLGKAQWEKSGKEFKAALEAAGEAAEDEKALAAWNAQRAQTDLRMIDDSPEAIARFKELHKQTTAPEQQTRIKAYILDGLKKRGIKHPISLAMAMASVERESSFSPYSVGDSGDARGLFQWNYGTRREAAPPVSGSLFEDIDNQLDYFVYELSIPEYAPTSKVLDSPDSVEQAAEAMKHYEKYDDTKGETAHRIKAADRWLKEIIGVTN